MKNVILPGTKIKLLSGGVWRTGVVVGVTGATGVLSGTVFIRDEHGGSYQLPVFLFEAAISGGQCFVLGQDEGRHSEAEHRSPQGHFLDLKYATINGAITITKYNGRGGAVAIPDKIDACPVAIIGARAFESCTSLTNITIPKGVTQIGDYTFCGCKALTNVTIPKGVTHIGRKAFESCPLTTVTIPDSVTNIGDAAFEWCPSLTSVTIPSSVTSIGDWTFGGCKALTSVTIPSSVTRIGGWAFRWCEALTSVTIPKGVTHIGEDAFERCTSLACVPIPKGVKTVGKEAFGDRTRVVRTTTRGWFRRRMVYLDPEGVSGRSKPATSGRIKPSHFEVR